MLNNRDWPVQKVLYHAKANDGAYSLVADTDSDSNSQTQVLPVANNVCYPPQISFANNV